MILVKLRKNKFSTRILYTKNFKDYSTFIQILTLIIMISIKFNKTSSPQYIHIYKFIEIIMYIVCYFVYNLKGMSFFLLKFFILFEKLKSNILRVYYLFYIVNSKVLIIFIIFFELIFYTLTVYTLHY